MTTSEAATHAAFTAACARIAPSWPLTHFVAANPFLGVVDMPFGDAVTLIERTRHAALLPGAPDPMRTESLADVVDRLAPETRLGTGFVVDEISKWCASYFDRGQAAWAMPWRDQPLWTAWRAAAEIDANPEWTGLRDFRARVRQLPADPSMAIASAVEHLGVPAAARTRYFLRLLMSVAGWSGYVQYRVRERRMSGGQSDELTALLAIRLVFEAALYDQAGPALRQAWRASLEREAAHTADDAAIAARLEQLVARERPLQDEVARRLTRRPAAAPTAQRPALQAVFCIDVRSERIRRALESLSPAIETSGFAGFFGLPLAWHTAEGTEARCPALLCPTLPVHSPAVAEDGFTDAWQSFRTSALSCFTFVETLGLGYIAPFVRRLFRRAPSTPPAFLHTPLPLDLPIGDRVALAASILKGIGLTERFAPIVLLCGHGATTANNPHATSLDCGACGGHAGDVNARAAATLLNDPWVRFGLTTTGIVIPGDTRFVAALHDTTTDDISVGADDLGADARAWLEAASAITRRERAAALGFDAAAPDIDDRVRRRSADWSEVRPEWGLAGNALFIAAPRARTRGLSFDGRAFLHDYRPEADVDGSGLEAILAAPMVVASWINLQYFASAADNERFGAGNKVLHNVVGAMGVWEGNGGDLRLGLPAQSVHDGAGTRHDAVRLSVFVEAPLSRIDAVLDRRQDVRDLVWLDWVHLFAIDPADGRCRRFASGRWEPVSAADEAAADEALLAAAGRAMDDGRGVDERESVAELARQ